MRLLITGVSGFLGWNLAKEAITQGHQVLGSFCRHEPPEGITALHADFEDRNSIRNMIASARPDAVIHAAAASRMDECERDPDRAWRLNAEATHELAKALEEQGGGAQLIYCSTDMVFDGLNPPYAEESPVSPRHAYGRTKAGGENAAKEYAGRWAIARLALMFGIGSPSSASFIGWMDRGLRGDGAAMFCNEFRTHLYVRDAAIGLLAIAERGMTGVFHLAGAERLARDEFARIYTDVFGLDQEKVKSVALPHGSEAIESGNSAMGSIYRPPDVSLTIDRARSILGFGPMSAREALEDMKQRR